jgi:serine/threonine protein kinase
MDAATIFAEALDKTDDGSRARFLDEACGENAALRVEVLELLQAHEGAGDFLVPQDNPALVATQFARSLTEKAGDQIGPYKLLQQIGEGGFGVVYMAEQTEPVRRKVALKVIKPGMDTKEVIARFEAERQALALMDHPNIAKVLDGGTTESGRPYFVMELVKGIRITQFCDENKLDVKRRLELFCAVCRAIQHAHQKGVIHRDIKPNNVLVTLHDGEPVPKVIDFGVAKAISQQLTEKTMFTAYGQMIGTPQYMSPEQAEMSGLDVDTRSDIFSLGVLLYELLTGTTPLDPRKLRETAFHELQRMIREEEPPRPSTRITTLSEQSAKIASNRDTAPDKLGAVVRGDLDWIVMRSLEKNRERRYDSANALAVDVLRALGNEPVEACPPSLAYKFRKYARRNRSIIFTSAAIATALVIGLSVATWQAVRATNLLDRAVAAENKWRETATQASMDAKRANDAEELARSEARIASENEQAVTSVIGFLVKELISHANPYVQHDRSLTVSQLLERISSSPETSFPSQPRAEASVRHFLGVICHRAGLIEQAQQHLSRALELREQEVGIDHVDTARTQFALAYALFDFRRYQPTPEKRANYVRRRQLIDASVRTLEKELGPKAPETLHAMALQAFVVGHSGRQVDEAEELYQELITRAPEGLKSDPDDPLDLLGSVYVLIHREQVGRDAKVDKEIRLRFQIACTELPAKHPQRAFWTEWYGQSLYFQGKVDEAAPYFQEAHENRKEVLGSDNYFTFLSGRALAALLARQGKTDESIELLEECLTQVPDHAAQALTLGVLYLNRGHEGDRRKWFDTAADLLNRYERTDNSAAINNVLKLTMACSTESPDEKALQQNAIALARRYRADLTSRFGHDIADAPEPEGTRADYVLQNSRLAIAFAEFRDGEFVRAEELLIKVEQGSLLMIRAIAFAAHATIAAKQGDHETARKLIKDATNAAIQAPDEEIHHQQFFAWNRPFMFELMLDEATETLEAATKDQ